MRSAGNAHQLAPIGVWLALLTVGCEGTGGDHAVGNGGIDAAYAQDSGSSPNLEADAQRRKDAATPRDALASEAGTDDSATASEPFLCPPQEPEACTTPSTGLGWEVLLDAAEFGADAHFVAMGQNAVLVQGGEAPWRLVRLQPDTSETRPVPRSIWSFPPGDGLGIDVTEAFGTRLNGVFALVCETDMPACRLLHGGMLRDAGSPVLAELARSTLPSDIQPRGMVYDRALDALCVFGNGLVCLEDEWITAIPPGNGLTIHAVVPGLGGSSMVAIGAGGRWWRRAQGSSEVPASWMEQPALGGGEELVGASIAGNSLVLFGKQAWWWSAEDGPLERCAFQRELTAVFLHLATPFTEIVEASGEVVAYQMTSWTGSSPWGWCQSQRLVFGASPVLDLAIVPCGISSNPRVLTASKLVGTSSCAMD